MAEGTDSKIRLECLCLPSFYIMPTNKTRQKSLRNFVPSGVSDREDKSARDKIISGNVGKNAKKNRTKLGNLSDIKKRKKRTRNRMNDIMSAIRSQR